MNNEKFDSRTADKFVLRLPDGMRQQVADESKAAHISMNSYMIQAIGNRLENEQRLETLIKILESMLLKEAKILHPSIRQDVSLSYLDPSLREYIGFRRTHSS